MNGLRDAESLTLANERFGDRGTRYTADLCERVTEASLADLGSNPYQTVATLASPLLRSLGSYRRWANHLNTSAAG